MGDSKNQLNPPQQASYPLQQVSNHPQVSNPPRSYSPQLQQCVQAQQPQYGSQALGKWHGSYIHNIALRGPTV